MVELGLPSRKEEKTPLNLPHHHTRRFHNGEATERHSDLPALTTAHIGRLSRTCGIVHVPGSKSAYRRRCGHIHFSFSQPSKLKRRQIGGNLNGFMAYRILLSQNYYITEKNRRGTIYLTTRQQSRQNTSFRGIAGHSGQSEMGREGW